MDSALIVSGEKGIAYFTEVLTSASFGDIVGVSPAGEARRLLIERDFDICIVNAPLSDEHGARLAESTAERGTIGVILCVRAEHFDEISAKVEDYGVVTVSKPLSRALFWNALKLTMATHRRMQSMQSENRRLVQKLEDIRVVDRAKCMLISYLSMSESEAHKYIEKQAMDKRLTKREIAERILKTYEN